jgi:hypothetical protein
MKFIIMFCCPYVNRHFLTFAGGAHRTCLSPPLDLLLYFVIRNKKYVVLLWFVVSPITI